MNADGVRAWLEAEGFGRFADLFEENEIDREALLEVNDEHLKELGVPIGPRLKLLKAIGALKDGKSRGVMPAVAEAVPPASKPTDQARLAERRQLTVMFVDLVGSTAMSAKLDPEDMREVIRAYQNAVAGEIVRLEGHVAKFMGDGVLAYVGWPRAHEDDPERAVRAGLAVMQAMAGIRTSEGQPLAARIGIATGLVVVGDLVGEGAAQEEAVVGETPNLAARLQGLAEPGQIVIAESTRRLLGDVFELADLGTQSVKGIAEPMPVFAILRERSAESRFEARSGPSLLPMVGRDQELALLLERWSLAKVGEGQGVLLVGEAGIGKSRIARALLDAVAEEPHLRIRYQCSPYHTDSALWPVIRQLSDGAGIAADDVDDTKLDKLEALLARAGADAVDDAPLIADLIGLNGEARYGARNLTPEAQRTQTLEALVSQLLGLGARQPVLMVLEDAHWIDPTTLELIEQCLDRIADAPALILITSRPDRQPEIAAHPHITRLTLNRLRRAGVEAIVARLSGASALPRDLIETIVTRTDGVPLFVEELTKTVLESGLLREAADRYELVDPLPSLTIPNTLRDSLMARLDRLAKAKEIAQIAAVIGREFSRALLAAVAERPDAEVLAALDQLIASGLVFHRGAPPDVTYVFKHALVQEAAYQSLLRSHRHILHLRIAKALEVQFPQRAALEPELLAHHFAAAQVVDSAITYLERAASRAIERSSNVEAVAHLQEALELCRRLPESGDRDQRELCFQLRLGPALMSARGWSAPEVRLTYERARALCTTGGQGRDLFVATWGMWMHHQSRAEHREARPLTEELLAAAEASCDSGLRLQSHHATWTTCLYTGELEAAIDHCRRGLELYDIDQHGEHAFSFAGHDPGVCGNGQGALMHWLHGYPDRASVMSEAAIDLARRLGHGASSAHALLFGARFQSMRRNHDAARRLAATSIELAQELSLPIQLAGGIIVKGWAEVMTGAREGSLDSVKRAFEMRQKIRAGSTEPFYLALQAEAHMTAGYFDEAERIVADAIRFAEDKGERSWEAELFRLRGELRKRMAELDLARADFGGALKISRSQHARSLELRAAISLARLLTDQGNRAEARDLLAPIYDWFTEGFDTADLKDAKALLDELQY